MQSHGSLDFAMAALGMAEGNLSLVATSRKGERPYVMVSAAERSGAKSNQMAPWQRGRGGPKGTI
jgi:hypothetical protein